LPKTWLSWSSGKDSAFTLSQISSDVTALFTTVNEKHGRVSMHGVRNSLLDNQARQLGLPMYKIKIPDPCTNEIYAEKMTEFISFARASGVSQFAFGDLFLKDVREYRIRQLAGTKI